MNHNILAGGGGLFWSLMMFLVIFPLGIDMPNSIEISALSPVFWPRIVVGLAGISSIFLLVQGAYQFKKAGSVKSENVAGEYYPCAKALTRVLVVFIIVFSVFFLIDLLGLVLPTIVSLGILFWHGGERDLKKIILLSIGLPLLLFVFFQFIAGIPIPLGELEYLFFSG